ncbi:hypothetical protein E3N88_29136 [Mikania micrantha]|uniref:Uncharacterized protein n=1 Tax=Mikania micrantha TaxID=192012 RepID=A0A5N6N4B1_9ASTR|nr:hypothetical protein E3N88_29136 [Mikania micrantha]
MFQFARLSLACPWIQLQFERLTYSGISGSMLIFNSPKHFVAYYALPRLWVPSANSQGTSAYIDIELSSSKRYYKGFEKIFGNLHTWIDPYNGKNFEILQMVFVFRDGDGTEEDLTDAFTDKDEKI